MKKSRGQDWLDKHNSKMAAKQKQLDERINRITTSIDDMNRRMSDKIRGVSEQQGAEALRQQFYNGTKVGHYNWTCEYSFWPARRCFASGRLILPGCKAYKGKQNYIKTGKTTEAGFFIDVNIYPDELWLSKEEFTVRKLKGLL